MTHRAAHRRVASPGTSHPNSAAAQRARVLAWLHERPLSTIDAREQIAVMHPAARVMELRHAGHAIITVRSREVATDGTEHNVAKYALVRSARRPK
ncbi:helix-turn-helix domain-containing protein [Paraburkholderia silviterrae]|uniref:Winged helix-turn-helix domain-containing protein n=1 Tax=Paraburkholderia silviterrae TaxID=2528715 RepID=A0A4R5MED4_9BURK|nr:helix-turn-helix domain-containing protein [Paraburkholderia silviterrae]TDG25123.1 hypothetical protein EYW47_04475 [Paraburkholderia silviterrae]